ncbi:MAG TPA: HAMP domain-containing histidine kinase [Sulfurospirillum arcachonense]|nr:HAMP domain-containing histidine kinase [Sulfurospirillum arcachonense]
MNISRHYDGILESDSYKEIIDILVDEFLDKKTNKIVVEKQLDDFKVFDGRKEFLYILFFHLFSNAKAILENVDKPLVTIKSYIKNGFLYIKVHDNGKLPNYPKRIFEEAYSERHDKGGFGLFHLKNRIEDKGGEIKFLVEPKKHFRITIPLNRIGEQNEE